MLPRAVHALALLSLLALPTTGHCADGLTMAPIWAASAVQLLFTILAGVGMALWQRSHSGQDDRSKTLERRVEQLERSLASTREDFAKRADLNAESRLFRDELNSLRRHFDDTTSKQNRKLDHVLAELGVVHRLVSGGPNG